MRLFGRRRHEEDRHGDTRITIDRTQGDPGAAGLVRALGANPFDWALVHAWFRQAPSPDHVTLYLRLAGKQQRLGSVLRHGPLRDNPDDVLALLLSGVRAINWAWEIRGPGQNDTVAENIWQIWSERLREAEDFLDRVVELDPSNAEAWHYLVLSGRARQLDQSELLRRFERLVGLQPTHLQGHTQMLESLTPSWGGSEEAMFGFARAVADRAPGTVLPVLIARAHLVAGDAHGGEGYLRRPEVSQELVLAADQSLWHPAFTASLSARWVRNVFAHVLVCADRFAEANRVFVEIGDDQVTSHPWELEADGPQRAYVRLRARAQAHL